MIEVKQPGPAGPLEGEEARLTGRRRSRALERRAPAVIIGTLASVSGSVPASTMPMQLACRNTAA